MGGEEKKLILTRWLSFPGWSINHGQLARRNQEPRKEVLKKEEEEGIFQLFYHWALSPAKCVAPLLSRYSASDEKRNR